MNARILALVGCLAAPAFAQQPVDDSSLGLTIYSSADPAGFDPQQFIAQQRMGHNPMFAWQVPGFGVVRETRTVDLQQGLNTLNFVDVARFIDPTTVSFLDLDDPERTAVLEQTFLFDLVSPEKLLEKYLGQVIDVYLTTDQNQGLQHQHGTLLSATPTHLVIQDESGVQIIPREKAQVHLGQLPGGLLTKPTLQWKVATDEAGQRPVRTSYQTNGITWRADYNLILNEDDTQADLGAWVTILNLSGKAYPNTRLKLIAGDVQRIQPPAPQPMRMRGYAGEMMVADAAAGFEEKSFFEYHLYTLPRPTDVADNTTQQITLFPTASGVDVEKVLVYYGLPEAQHWGPFPQPQLDRNFGNQSNKKVDVYIRFANEEENNLGMPLPAGKVRVYKLDTPTASGGEAGPEERSDEDPDRSNGSQGTLEFVGEDLIDHTPRDEKVLIRTGQAFDVVGERTQTDFTRDDRAHVLTETFRIQIRNHKDEAQKVVIKENLFRWAQWEIVEHSDGFEKVDARTIHFEVDAPARGEKTVTYTVKYTW